MFFVGAVYSSVHAAFFFFFFLGHFLDNPVCLEVGLFYFVIFFRQGSNLSPSLLAFLVEPLLFR